MLGQRLTLGRRRLAALTLAAPLLGGLERSPVAATPISRMETGWWRARHEAKLVEARAMQASGHPVQLVWLGDSITQDWELTGPEPWRDFAPVWQRFYGGRQALNLGFGGDTTAHLLWRMTNGELDGLRPKAAVVLIGANNMGRVHWSAPQTVAGITAVLDEARRRMPGIKILLVSVLPSIRSRYVDRTTEAINHELAARYGSGAVSGIAWVDVTRLFLRDGAVDRTQFFDDQLTPPNPPLHPTAQAQARLAEAIEPTLAAMLGDRSRVAAG
jgi:lysophospholipase L1-like esterase